jgi:ATP-dependent DNA helicase RecG
VRVPHEIRYITSGLESGQIDQIQKELLNLCYRITPNYFPVSEPLVVNGRHILVKWVSTSLQ